MRISIRILYLIILNCFILHGFAKELHVESLIERPEDLTANTYAILDLNNNKCALIKVAIPDKAGFEGNVIRLEYKINEYFVYLSPGTKKLAVKYPGTETLEVELSEFLDGSGVVSGRTYRLKLGGIPEDVPQVTILLPEKSSSGYNERIAGRQVSNSNKVAANSKKSSKRSDLSGMRGNPFNLKSGKSRSGMIDNQVLNHLRIHGYDVAIGKTGEPDYIAEKDGEIKYILTSMSIEDEDIEERLFNALSRYPGSEIIVVTLDDSIPDNDSGITYYSLLEFKANFQ